MEIKRIENIADFNDFIGTETLHPLISVIDSSKIDKPAFEGLFSFGFYFITLNINCSCKMKYGRNNYDYKDGAMVFIAPNQVIGSVEKVEETIKDNYQTLVFHPDLLHGTPFAQNISQHHYFNYEVNEALHLSERERKTILDNFNKIFEEISLPIDKHSRNIIVSSIELLLGYCRRFYDRQFITREILNRDILTRFETILNDYYAKGLQQELGIPTVKYIAGELSLSSNYMSDLIKKETGRSAIEHIQYRVFEKAKTELTTTKMSVSEIAHALGFEYSQYFSRQFKRLTGMTPNEYRTMA